MKTTTKEVPIPVHLTMPDDLCVHCNSSFPEQDLTWNLCMQCYEEVLQND